MEKDFLNLKNNPLKVSAIILCVGVLVTIMLAVNAYKNTKIHNGYELLKNEAGEGSYEQEIVARIDGMKKIPLTVTVEEKELTEEAADQIFKEAIFRLEEILLGENESFEEIREDLCFVTQIPETPVEVVWNGSDTLDYFYSDGRIREDVEVLEPVELLVTAVLECQNYTRDYKQKIMLFPQNHTIENDLLELINKSKAQNLQSPFLQLPTEYEGAPIVWRKPLDMTFLYFVFLTFAAVVFLKLGNKRDLEMEKKKRLEEMEKDYAQIVSKFSMLLSAGLSVRNAWERIVAMDRKRQNEKKAISEEMNWAFRELQKGMPELEVYENFGAKVGLVHYKKLMAMFVSNKRRGGVNLLEEMNKEMLLAWEEKRRKTKQQGEKIGAKLLVPMMGMLSIVFVMILVPAFLSFQL